MASMDARKTYLELCYHDVCERIASLPENEEGFLEQLNNDKARIEEEYESSYSVRPPPLPPPQIPPWW